MQGKRQAIRFRCGKKTGHCPFPLRASNSLQVKRGEQAALTSRSASSPMSRPHSTACARAATRAETSPKPRLTPWPARGCTEWAASPANANLGLTYLHNKACHCSSAELLRRNDEACAIQRAGSLMVLATQRIRLQLPAAFPESTCASVWHAAAWQLTGHSHECCCSIWGGTDYIHP